MTPLPLVVHGRTIAQTSSRGGKAGRGKASTASIQVRVPMGRQGYLVVWHRSFPLDDRAKREVVIQKALAWVDVSANND